MDTPPLPPELTARNRRAWSVGVVFIVLLAAALCFSSPTAAVVTLADGVSAALLLLPAAAAGLWWVRLLGLNTLEPRVQYVLGAALGIGTLPLLVLLLGLAGALQKGLWTALLAGSGVLGILAWQWIRVEWPSDARQRSSKPSSALSWLVLAMIPFAVVALLAASNAPGMLWPEEAFGYDVLEYHLQLPREYVEAGRISYRPHNVYGSFPANVEMLYLLAMVASGDPLAAGTIAQMIHLLLGVLTVASVWVIAREDGRLSGLVGCVLAGSCGWLVYVSALAYVENGLLLFGVLATGCLLAALREDRVDAGATPEPPRSRRRWALTSGLLAGLACGCKYTAVPMIALPLGLSWVFVRRGSPTARIRAGGAFALGCLVTFSPWLVKNFVETGNPVFPLANRTFNANPPGWGAEQTEKWIAGHRLPPPRDDATGAVGSTALRRLRLAWAHSVGDPLQRFGPAIFLIALGGLLRRRLERADTALLLSLAVGAAVWVMGTHVYARFAMPLLIPLWLLAARSVADRGAAGSTLDKHPGGSGPGAPRGVPCSRRGHGVDHVPCLRRVLVVVVLIGGAAWNAWFADGYVPGLPVATPTSVFTEGQLPGQKHVGIVNQSLAGGVRILLVGEARGYYYRQPLDYAVVFNRQPLAEAVRSARTPSDIVAWMWKQGYTHVLVDWSEVARFRRTYGFPAEIDPALFDELREVGLQLMRRFEHPVDPAWRYVELYRVVGAG